VSPASVESATSVESSATSVKPAASVEVTTPAKAARTTAESAVGKPARSAGEAAPPNKTAPGVASAKSAPTVVAAASVETVAVVATSPAEPRADADEHAVDEVIRAPITVGRAIIRSIVVVAVGAGRRRPVITAVVCRTVTVSADPHAHPNLSIRVCRDEKQNPKQSNVL
jgi:hypothetical protein